MPVDVPQESAERRVLTLNGEVSGSRGLAGLFKTKAIKNEDSFTRSNRVAAQTVQWFGGSTRGGQRSLLKLSCPEKEDEESVVRR